MSTPKNEITNTFLSLIDDRGLCVDLTDQEMTELLDYYLNESTYLRFKKCTKDLSDQELYDFHTDTFTADGINKTYILSDYPSTPNEDAISYICTVNETNVDYTFTEGTLTFELDDLPTAGDEVVVGYNFVGQMNEDLSQEEIWILAYGMILSWFSPKLYKTENFKNRVTPKDYNSFSSANLLDKLLQLKKDARKELKCLINGYTYNGFTGFD